MTRKAIALIALIGALILCWTGPARADQPVTFEPGTGKYILVLEDPRTEVDDPVRGKRRALEPDVQKHGGTVLHRRDATRIIKLPTRAATALRKEENVAYLQRIWLGESREEWGEEAQQQSSLKTAAPETLDTELTWTTGTYLYDGSGNIKQIGADTYRYDTLGRLTQAVVKGITETYQYDAFGNLIAKTVNGQPRPIPVDASSNRLQGEAYDAAGNVTTQAGQPRYHYDSFSMVDRWERPPSNRKRYIYGPDDERIGVVLQEGQFSRWKIRDFNGKVLREFKSDDTQGIWEWMEDYAYADGRLLAAERESYFGGKRHFHTDHLGSVRMITDQNRKRIAVHDYSAFGVEQTDATQEYHRYAGAGGGGDFRAEPMKFTGHERDQHGWLNVDNDDSLDYMHARYYDPNLGRFLTVDPTWESADLTKPQSWNRYSYVLNDPVNMVDPDGKVSWDLVEAVLSGDTPLFEAKYDPSGGTLPKDSAERARYIELNNKDPHRRPSTLSPGPHSGESIPARDSQPKFTPEERAKMNEVGKNSGCHTCGSTDPKTKSGNFVPDHQPPSKINPPGQPQKLYPHCIECSRKQGGQVRKFLIELAEKARKLIPGI